MRIWFKLCLVLVTLGTAALGLAEPEYLETINAKYKLSDAEGFGAKSCGMCHISDEDFGFNPYGKQLAQYMTANNLKAITDAALAAVEAEDADGDGASNGDELAKGGDPTQGAAPAPAEPATEESAPKPLIPKNGYHPAVVHFPIALLIAGLALDFFGLLTKQKMLLFAGWYNLVLSAVTSLAAIATGFLAMTFLKLPYKGLIFNHMLYALGVSFIIWIMVALRVHKHEQMNLLGRVFYYALAVVAFGMISWAGHLGGLFVYGE